MKCASCAGVGVPSPSKARWAIPAAAVALVAIGVVVALVAGGSGGGGGSGAAGPDPVDAPGAGRSAATERTVELPGAGGVRVGATLTLPVRTGDAKVPAVVIVGDTGPTTRDGVVAPTGAIDALYRDLARALADAGMASLRYDRRGTGTTKLAPGQSVTLDDLVADAREGVNLLADRIETAGAPVAVLGHGVGGDVALREAAADPRVRSVVLVSTAGRPQLDVLAEGFKVTNGQASADAFRAVAAQVLDTGTVPPLETIRTEQRDLFLSGDPAWLRTLLTLDPSIDAARVSQPVLVVRGSRSTSDMAVDADRLAAALGARGEQAVGPDDTGTLQVMAAAPLTTLDPATANSHEAGMGVGGASTASALSRDTRLLGSVAAWLHAHLT